MMNGSFSGCAMCVQTIAKLHALNTAMDLFVVRFALCSDIEENLSALKSKRSKRSTGNFNFNDFNTLEDVSRYISSFIALAVSLFVSMIE